MSFKPGTDLKGYPFVIEERIGQGKGGMAEIYLALHKNTREWVALKIARVDGDAFENTLRVESSVLEALWAVGGHPAIVKPIPVYMYRDGRHPPLYRARLRIRERGKTRDISFIALEYLAGDSLADWLKKQKRLSPAETARLLIPVAEALAFIHEHKYTHLDLKPENIIFRHAGEPPREPVLIDFGIARKIGDPEMLGYDPRYCAPERLIAKDEGQSIEAHPSMDMFSLGIILYQCLTGKYPYRRRGLKTTTAFLREADPVSFPPDLDIPESLRTLIHRLLDRHPSKRPSARDVADVLREFYDPLQATTPSPKPSTKPSTKPSANILASLPADVGTPRRSLRIGWNRLGRNVFPTTWHTLLVGGILGTALILFFIVVLSMQQSSRAASSDAPRVTPGVIQQQPSLVEPPPTVAPSVVVDRPTPTALPTLAPTRTPRPTSTRAPTPTPLPTWTPSPIPATPTMTLTPEG